MALIGQTVKEDVQTSNLHRHGVRNKSLQMAAKMKKKHELFTFFSKTTIKIV
jgi:hypothetical protein